MEYKKIGFLILSISANDPNLLRLLNKLTKIKGSRIAIHHDFSKDGKRISHEVIENYNILPVEPIYKTYWSHTNNVIATIDGLKKLYDETDVEWFVTLTPSCYPIKPVLQIQQFYNHSQYDALIDMHHIGNDSRFKELDKFIIRDFLYQPWIYFPFITRKGKPCFRTIRKKVSISPHPFLEKYIPYHGSNWFSINRKTVTRIISDDVINGDLMQFYKKYIVANPNMHPCPQEIILPTFIGNINSIKIKFYNYHLINWENAVDWHPNTLTEKHWELIKNSDANFARKFLYPDSNKILDLIDTHNS